MRFTHIAMALAVVGSCSLWAAEPARNEGSPINARRALGQNVSELNVEGVSFSKVVEFLRLTSGANIVVNWKILEGAGVSKDTPITLQVRELSLRKMLRLVLDQASPGTQLTFSTDANVIEVTSQDEADKVLITKVYIVDDLVMTDNQVSAPPSFNLSTLTKGGTSGQGGGAGTESLLDSTSTTSRQPEESTQKRGEDLAALVRDVVRPAIWKENGGNCSIRYFSGKLIVSAPASVHEAIGGPVLPEGGQRFGM